MLKERMFLSNYTRLGGLFRIKETGRSIHTSYRRDYNTPDKIQLLHTSLAIRRTRLLNINLPIFSLNNFPDRFKRLQAQWSR